MSKTSHQLITSHCRFLPAERHQECGVLLQVRARLRDGHVHAAEVPGVPAQEVPGRRDAAGVRRAGEPVRHQAEGEESPEGEGQGANERHRQYNEQHLPVGDTADPDEM